MNKKRIIALLLILQRYSDDNHPLSINEIYDHLSNKYGISDLNRKTIYDDIKVLNSFDGIDIQISKKGYSLESLPFSIPEIKILLDGISALKNLDSKNQKSLKTKLYQLASENYQKMLEVIDYQLPKKGQKHFLYVLQTILDAIFDHHILSLNIKNKQSLLKPYYIYRLDDYYYLFYTYTNSSRIYRVRLDRIDDCRIIDESFALELSKDDILNELSESTGVFHNQEVRKVKLEILNLDTKIIARLNDDFSNVIINEKKAVAYLKISVNDAFFSKLASYKNNIKVLEPHEVVIKYQDFVEQICELYRPEKRGSSNDMPKDSIISDTVTN